jgi:DNA-binding response OmpR family regulator
MSGPKLLVVDDDKDLLQLLAAQLQAGGFQIQTASDGVSAIMTAQRYKPDAILLDIGLPGGDGYLVMDRLRALAPFARVPIIVITGRTLTSDEEKKVRSQAHALLHKPVELSQLLTAIRTALGELGNPHSSGATHSPTA